MGVKRVLVLIGLSSRQFLSVIVRYKNFAPCIAFPICLHSTSASQNLP
nr:MAG TPA: hypothetical protein [Caudoviricetes sp.]